jgi:hypothetical protein
MRARVPVDVDLEDRLLYGLTPIRLGYVVVLLLAATASVRSSGWLPIRVAVAVLCVVGAGVAGWIRYDGRYADRWLIDAALFVISNYRIDVPAASAVIGRLRQVRQARSRQPTRRLRDRLRLIRRTTDIQLTLFDR